MTPTMEAFVVLERKKAEIKKYFEDLAVATEALVKEIGVGSYFQDEQGIVYKTTIPDGKFVHFEKYGVDRTKRTDETRGTLSAKEAQAAGYNVK